MKRFIATVLMMLVAGLAHAAAQVSGATPVIPPATAASGTRLRSAIPNPLVQQTIPNDQTIYYGAPYYCNDYHFGGCGLHATVQGAIQGWWAAYKAFWGVNDSNCSYYYILTGSDGTKKTFALMYIFGSACSGGPSGIYGTPVQLELSITAQTPIIPYGSGVSSDTHHVLTRSWLQLLLKNNDQPVSGQNPPIQSSRGKLDTIDELDVTNSEGISTGYVDTRDQPGTSVITSASSKISTAKEGDITWLPALYQGEFEVTCYGVAHEKHDTSGPLITMPGLPGKHHKWFDSDSRMQGTGYTLGGQYIQLRYDRVTKTTKWEYEKCPYTASGYCAYKGETIAVDRTVIPVWGASRPLVFGQVSISGIGSRVALDTGKGINGNHIDLFYGRTWPDYKACKQWGVSYGHDVALTGYAHKR